MTEDPTPGEILRAARCFVAAGLSIIPIGKNKRPALTDGVHALAWACYQSRQPSDEEIRNWFSKSWGIGVVCGLVSGNVEVLDFDDPVSFPKWRDELEAHKPGLFERLMVIQTPRGGYHISYRCSEIFGSKKLARRLRGVPEGAHGAVQRNGLWTVVDTLIETKGEGGYVVTAPCPRFCHPSGKHYQVIAGEWGDLTEVSPDECALMIGLACSFDEYIEPERKERPRTTRPSGQRPGDDFNNRATWEQVLEPHGWKVRKHCGGVIYWQRPGPSKSLTHATTNYRGKDLLHIFTTSTPFEPERSYDKFAAYTILDHEGDFQAAARALSSRGYGSDRRHEPFSSAVEQNGESQLKSPGGAGVNGGRLRFEVETPQIDARDQDLPRVTKRAWEALSNRNNPPFLFRYSDIATRIEHDDSGMPVPRFLTVDRLRHEVARAAYWYKIDRIGAMKPAFPPVPVVRDMLATPDIQLPVLSSIIEAPVFARDGTLHDEPGYDPGGRTYYAPSESLKVEPIAKTPTREEVDRAKGLIVDELLGDFPFVGAAERAHTVGLFILPYVRGLIDGPTPLHLIEKPSPGTGASLLVDVVSVVATGRPITALTEGRDEDEWRKRLTARLRTGAPILLIDNLRRRLDSAALSAAITSRIWEDRLLGASETIRLPVHCLWVATGNNPGLSSEMARRSVRIRLDARQDRPWLRSNFQHSNLRDWVLQNRSRLVRAALILGRAWIAEGQPVETGALQLGMFESWSRVIGGILKHAGVVGFLQNLSDFYEMTDAERTTMASFFSAWWERFKDNPVGVADVWKILTESEFNLDLGDKSERSQKIRLGKLLVEQRDRIYRIGPAVSVCIVSAGEMHRAQQWRLVSVSTG